MRPAFFVPGDPMWPFYWFSALLILGRSGLQLFGYIPFEVSRYLSFPHTIE